MLATTRSRPLSSSTRGGTLGRVGLLAVGCLVALALLTSDAFAGQLPVGLGAADSFAALSGTTVTNTGFSTLNGDLGVSPGSALTGFPPGKVNGTVHATDPVANQAQTDLTAAYNDAAGRTPPNALPADVGGRTLAPGVYKAGAGLAVTGTVTLDGQGDPNAVFVFQVGSTLTTSVASSVNLIGGAQPCNVSWQIGSSATLGTSSVFAGNILALTSISINDGVTVNGRALARNGAVTLINDTITAAHCAPGTAGGPPLPGGTTGGPPLPGGTTGGPPLPGGMTGGDTRAPEAPVVLSPRAHERVPAGNVSFRWRAAARAERYTLMVDHHRMNTGRRTRAMMRVRPGSHTFRVIAKNRYGARSSRHRPFRAVAATEGPSVDRIRRHLGLDALEKDVVASAERITLQAAEGTAFRSVLRSLGKFASRASILGVLVSLGFETGDLDCEQGPLYAHARPVFKDVADGLDRAARAGVGRHSADLAKIAKVRGELRALKKYTDAFDRRLDKECKGPGKVTLQTIKTLQSRLDAAGARLQKLSAKPRKKTAKEECLTTKKILRQFRSKIKRYAPNTSEKRLKELQRLLDEGKIRPVDLPASVRRGAGIPDRFLMKTIREIEQECP